MQLLKTVEVRVWFLVFGGFFIYFFISVLHCAFLIYFFFSNCHDVALYFFNKDESTAFSNILGLLCAMWGD